jgi:regulator of RNase E activity RraA
MAELPFRREDLERLAEWDTPTICNALELIVPERRAVGFTTAPLVAADPSLPPIVGLARTGTIRAKEPPRGPVAERAAWYEYVAATTFPTIAVLQDLDDTPGFGAFWGEVNSNVHLALGVRGAITNGSFRDLGALAPGFQILGGMVGPSHAHVHIVDFGRPVNVAGMTVGPDDVVHADRHGAVVIPAEAVRRLPEAVMLLSRREKVILEMCSRPDFSPALLREAFKRAAEIH